MLSFKATILLIACLTAGTLVAQQPTGTQSTDPDTTLGSTPTPEQSATAQAHAPNPEKQAKNLAKQLGLSREQEAQIRPILADRDRQVAQLRGNMAMAPRERRARMLALQQTSTAKIEALLSDTQKKQYEQIIADRRNRVRRAPKA